jgi:hypothetical protein
VGRARAREARERRERRGNCMVAVVVERRTEELVVVGLAALFPLRGLHTSFIHSIVTDISALLRLQ